MGIPMRDDQVYAWKTLNARVWPEPPRTIPELREKNMKHVMRFGSQQANALLLLELGAVHQIDSFDIEWYEGLFLRRLRAKLFAQPEYTAPYKHGYDHVANTYQYDWIDLEAVLTIGKRRYRRLLVSVLQELYAETGLTGTLTATVFQQYRVKP